MQWHGNMVEFDIENMHFKEPLDFWITLHWWVRIIQGVYSAISHILQTQFISVLVSTPACRSIIVFWEACKRATTIHCVNSISVFRWFQGFDWDGLDNRNMVTPLATKVSGPRDTSHFDKYPQEMFLPCDELSGWDAEFWLVKIKLRLRECMNITIIIWQWATLFTL